MRGAPHEREDIKNPKADAVEPTDKRGSRDTMLPKLRKPSRAAFARL
jgi:hypothetical protein